MFFTPLSESTCQNTVDNSSGKIVSRLAILGIFCDSRLFDLYYRCDYGKIRSIVAVSSVMDSLWQRWICRIVQKHNDVVIPTSMQCLLR